MRWRLSLSVSTPALMESLYTDAAESCASETTNVTDFFSAPFFGAKSEIQNVRSF